MKSIEKALCISTLALIGLFGCQESVVAGDSKAEKSTEINVNKDDISKGSYALGFQQVSRMLSETGGAIETDAFLKGVADAVGGRTMQISDEEARAGINAVIAKVQAAQTAAAEAAVSDGAAYLEAYAQQEGAVKLPSGMVYKVIKAGDGPKPGPTDTVVTHYHGTLIDGQVFDSSVQRNSPATFPVNGVIAGWTEALQLMSVGSKWELVIPPELAYGERGAGGAIGPNTTLKFEVELLEIK